MASETFDEQTCLVTKSYLATKVVTMVKLLIWF